MDGKTRCPVCGRNSVGWEMTNYHDGKAVKCALICEYGDFGTRETSPSKAVEEYNSAMNWNIAHGIVEAEGEE